MPYKNDPRRTITLNLPPAEYTDLAEDALEAGYATPGTYALALVRARGDAPEPILDECTEERLCKLEGQRAWLLQQFEAQQAQLQAAGLSTKLATGELPDERPRSRLAQARAVARAVAEALQRERTRGAGPTAPTAP